jgi:hypothetical protein
VLLLVAGYDGKGRGLPLAEQPGYRPWCGVEGGTVLSHNSSSLEENIRHGYAKAKLIVFINDSKNGNVQGSRQLRSAYTATATMERSRPLSGCVLSIVDAPEALKIERWMLLRQMRHR